MNVRMDAEKKVNAIKSLKTATINAPDGPVITVMVGIDVPDPGEVDAFMLLVAEKFKAQRMISPVETAGLLVTIIGELPAQEFARRWNDLASGDGILEFFMKQMRVADVVRGTPAGQKLDSVSLLEKP